MSIFRLVPAPLLLAFGITLASAQSYPQKDAAEVQPEKAVRQSSSSFELISTRLKTDLETPEPLDRFRIEDYRLWPNQLRLGPVLDLRPGPPEKDVACFATRTYKVARDNAESDSTHFVSYSTCEPSNRIRVHTTEERVVLTRP